MFWNLAWCRRNGDSQDALKSTDGKGVMCCSHGWCTHEPLRALALALAPAAGGQGCGAPGPARAQPCPNSGLPACLLAVLRKRSCVAAAAAQSTAGPIAAYAAVISGGDSLSSVFSS